MLMIIPFVMLGLSALVQAQPPSHPNLPPDSLHAESAGKEPTITLEELVKAAVERNPAIQAAQRAVEAKELLITPAGTLPEPTLTFQTMGDFIPPTLMRGDPSSARTFGLEQEIPFPGKLGIKSKIAAAEAEVERWNYERIRLEVIAEIKQAYYDLCFLHKSLEIVRKDKELLRKFAQVAEEKYRVGQGIQQDVLKAHVEISKLDDRLTVLEGKRGITESLINSLLYRPSRTPVGIPEPIQKSELRYSLEELEELARKSFPMLKMQEREIARNQYAVELADKEFYPDFSFGFTYFNREDMPEMYGLMVSAKIPLYFWRKQRPELEAARLNLVGAERQHDSTASSLHYKLGEAHISAVQAERLIQLYSKGVIPQATLSLESSIAGYQVGNVDFLTLIDNLVTLLEYELKYHESLTDFQKALARLEPLVGVELTH
jgi:cobalt-zinc-cadmium efflux system outer membrane protein